MLDICAKGESLRQAPGYPILALVWCHFAIGINQMHYEKIKIPFDGLKKER